MSKAQWQAEVGPRGARRWVNTATGYVQYSDPAIHGDMSRFSGQSQSNQQQKKPSPGSNQSGTSQQATKPKGHSPNGGIAEKPANQSEILSKVSKKASHNDLHDYMREKTGVSNHFDVSKLDKKVASQFDGHGCDLKGLTHVLNNGIDSKREFYSETLGAEQGSGKLLKDHSNFIMLGHPGQTIKQGGVGGVIVDELHADSIPDLKAAFPGVAFIPSKKAAELLPKVAAGSSGKAVKYT